MRIVVDLEPLMGAATARGAYREWHSPPTPRSAKPLPNRRRPVPNVAHLLPAASARLLRASSTARPTLGGVCWNGRGAPMLGATRFHCALWAVCTHSCVGAPC